MKKIGSWVAMILILCSFCACQTQEPNVTDNSSLKPSDTASSQSSSSSFSGNSSFAPESGEPQSSATASSKVPEPLAQKEKLQQIVYSAALSDQGQISYWNYSLQEGGELTSYKTPEKIKKLFYGAGIGESGAFYRFPEITVNMAGALEKIDLPADTVQISAGYGDYALVTKEGKLYTVGALSLYGGHQLINEETLKKERNKAIQAIVPEPVKKAVMTEYYLFLLGKSGAIYAAPLKNVNEFFDDISVFPKTYPAKVFQKLPTDKKVTDICAAALQTAVDDENTDLRGNALWILYEDGSIAYVDECRQIYTTLKKPVGGKWPVLEVKSAAAGGEKVSKIIANDGFSAVAFQTVTGNFYALGIDGITTKRQTKENERVPQKLSLPNGAVIKNVYPCYACILLLDETGKTWIIGDDYFQHFKIDVSEQPWIPQEISGIDWKVLKTE